MKKAIITLLIISIFICSSNTFAAVGHKSIIEATLIEVDKRLEPLEREIEQLRAENQELRKDIDYLRNDLGAIQKIVMIFQGQIIEVQKIVISFARNFLGRQE